jgi:hypothetical protein
MPEINVSNWSLGLIIAIIGFILTVLLVILGRLDLIVGLLIAGAYFAIIAR